jgi:hypothetical protein
MPVITGSLSLWGTLNSFFGGTGLHWDRSFGGGTFGIQSPIWVDTSTSASGYSVSNSNTYSIVAEGQDTLGDEGVPLTIATTTMVFPFLTSSGGSSTSAGAPVFSQTNGVESAAIVYWTAGSSAGQYNFVLQDVTENVNNVATGTPSLSLSGSPVTLETNVALTPGSDGWTWTNNSTNFVLAYNEGTTVDVQGFSATGTATTSLASISSIGTYEITEDASGGFHWFTTGTSGGNVTEQTYNATTGVFGTAQTITTDLTAISQQVVRYSSNNDGSFMLGMEGTNASSQNVLEYDIYNASGSLVGTSHQFVLNATSEVHVDVRSLGVNGEYVIAYSDATTPGGSTFDTYMMIVDASGNVLISPTQIGNGSLTGFDRIRGLGNGLVEIDYRQGTSGNVVAYIYDTRTAGMTVTGTSANDDLAGTTGTSSLAALGGNDIISPALGTETIDGGTGFNTVEFHAASSNFTLANNGNGSWSASASYSNDGFTNTYSDTLTNVEVVHFTDKSMAIRTRTADDFSQSGTSDILFRNESGGDTGLYIMSNGVFQTWDDIGPSSTAYSIVGVGDFLGNGGQDVLYENLSGGDVGYYQINSSGALAGWTDIGPANTAYTVVGTGDFYGTGQSEILFRNNVTGDTGFYALDASGHLQAWHDIGASSTAYAIVGVGDFNGDGTSDILYRNNTTGDTGFYQVNNGSLVGWTDLGTTSTAYSVVGVGDFLGNGTEEALFRNNTTGDTGFFTGGGPVVPLTWHDLGPSASSYQVVGVGNYEGDATSDILFRNNTTGDTGFYQIENGAISTWHDIGPSNTAYTVHT